MYQRCARLVQPSGQRAFYVLTSRKRSVARRAFQVGSSPEIINNNMGINILASDEGVGPCALSAGTWLENSSRGAYTTARTVGGSSVFELSFHIQRLATSSAIMLESDVAEGKPGAHESRQCHLEAVTVTSLRPRVRRSMQKAVAAYREASDDRNGEVKLTVLVTWAAGAEHGVQVLVHATSMPPAPTPPIKVQIRGAPRHNADAKDSDWVRARKVYIDQKPGDVEEVVLVNPSGGLLEGLSSNFYAIVDGQLRTAGEGVLKGSMREAVLRVAARQNVPVVLEAPRMNELSAWEGAFISSTSRLLLAVDEISAPDTTPAVTKVFKMTPLVSRLQAAVMEEVAACSEPLDASI